MPTVPAIIFFDIIGVLFNKIQHHEQTILEPIEPVVQLLPQLKGLVQLATLSNCSSQRWEELVKNHTAIVNHFDFHILSHRIGHKKPDTRIFSSACYETGMIPELSLFIDDDALNCQTAQSMGFKTIHCADHEAVATSLKKQFIA